MSRGRPLKWESLEIMLGQALEEEARIGFAPWSSPTVHEIIKLLNQEADKKLGLNAHIERHQKYSILTPWQIINIRRTEKAIFDTGNVSLGGALFTPEIP